MTVVSSLSIGSFQALSPNASILETQQWLHKNRFTSYARVFSSYTGEGFFLLRQGQLEGRLFLPEVWPSATLLNIWLPIRGTGKKVSESLRHGKGSLSISRAFFKF